VETPDQLAEYLEQGYKKMKYIIVKKDSLEIIGAYEASQPDLNRITASFEMVHVPLPDGLDEKHAKVEKNGNSYTASDTRSYVSSHSDRIEFGEKMIKDFMTANHLGGISEQVSYTIIQALLPIIVCLKIGSLATALYAIKSIPQNQRDGVYITDAKLLFFANSIEAFLGLPLSESV
jgi:hypothetical protein